MLVRLTAQAQIPEFVRACGYEHVFGSRALTALRAYGLEDDRARFYLCKDQNGPAAALYEANSVLTVSARPDAASEPVAELARETRVGEIDTNWAQCSALQTLLGGTTESSYYMVYRGARLRSPFRTSVPEIRKRYFPFCSAAMCITGHICGLTPGPEMRGKSWTGA